MQHFLSRVVRGEWIAKTKRDSHKILRGSRAVLDTQEIAFEEDERDEEVET
jgi:hypothetical protein